MPGTANWHALCSTWVVTCVMLGLSPQWMADLASAAGESEAGPGTSPLDTEPVRDPPLGGSARAPQVPLDGGYQWNRSRARREPGSKFGTARNGSRFKRRKKAPSAPNEHG